MRVVFAHHEPIDAGRARWVAIVRSLAAVAELTPVTWFTPDSPGRVREYAARHLALQLPAGLTIATLPSIHKRMGLTLNSVFFRAFRKGVAQARPDALWLRSDKLAAHAAHRRMKAPLVYEAHLVGELWARDRGVSERKAARLHELERDIYGHASGVAAITQGLLDEIRTRFGYTGPGEVIPSAVDTNLFKPVWQGGDGRTVAWVGTLQFWKGLALLLEALELAPGLRLKIVGGGKPEDEQRLRAEIERRGLGQRVELTGRVAQADIPLHVKTCACAVHPLPPEHSISARFTSPLKLFEYMAMGLPIVAADVPSAREVLRDGQTARLYQAGDARALTAALTEVASNGALASRLSANAAAEGARHGYGQRAARLLALFGQATSPSAG
ncbi:MAG: glycosyltransferase [Planctomycetes bacterium]|nr:glycosyltransferase [Planctomycetota bacterium]MCB9935404.1 glycosyltransferase [Planctomycetota bacterium]